MKKLNSTGIAHFAVLAVVVVGVAAVGTYVLVKSHAATCTDYTWSSGSSGSCVQYIQTLVNAEQGSNLSVDGRFGPATKSAVQQRQQVSWSGSGGSPYYGPITADGVVGPATWHKICGIAKAEAAPNSQGSWPAFYNAYTNANCAAKA